MNEPILVIGSGLGGLAVVRELRQIMPGENVLYFAFPWHVEQTAESLTQVIEYFLRHSPKHIVLACASAAATTLAELRTRFAGTPISSALDATGKAAAAAAGSKELPVIGILGDDAAVRAKAFEKSVHQRRRARLLQMATPLIAAIVEDGREAKDLLVQLAVEQYLAPLLEREVDVIVLGSAHQSIIKEAFAQRLDDIPLVDSCEQCAQDVARRLAAADRDQRSRLYEGSVECFVTADPSRLRWLAARSLGLQMAPPTVVSLDDLRGLAIDEPLLASA